MGDIIKVDFSGKDKAKTDVGRDKDSEKILKSEFEEWLRSSLVYRSLKKDANDVIHAHVEYMVAHIEDDPEWYTTEVLLGQLKSSQVPNKDDIIDTAVRLLAIIQVLRKRFGIKI